MIKYKMLYVVEYSDFLDDDMIFGWIIFESIRFPLAAMFDALSLINDAHIIYSSRTLQRPPHSHFDSIHQITKYFIKWIIWWLLWFDEVDITSNTLFVFSPIFSRPMNISYNVLTYVKMFCSRFFPQMFGSTMIRISIDAFDIYKIIWNSR